MDRAKSFVFSGEISISQKVMGGRRLSEVCMTVSRVKYHSIFIGFPFCTTDQPRNSFIWCVSTSANHVNGQISQKLFYKSKNLLYSVTEWYGIVQLFHDRVHCDWPLQYEEGTDSTYKLTDNDMNSCLQISAGDSKLRAKILRPPLGFGINISIIGKGKEK